MTNRRKHKRYKRLVNNRLNRKSYLKRKENKKKFICGTLKRLAPIGMAIMSAMTADCMLKLYLRDKHRIDSLVKYYK